MKKAALLLNVLGSSLLLVSCGVENSSVSQSTTGGTNSNASQNSTSNQTSTSSRTKTAAEVFQEARSKATTSNQFQYDFSLSAKLKYKGAVEWSPATISGTTSYNAGAGDTTYVQKRVTSGALLIDSTTYTYNKGTTYIKIAENDDDFSVTDAETVTSTYNFESKTFGKLLNYLDADKLDTVRYQDGTYLLDIKPTSSREAINDLVSHIDCNKVVDAISSITESTWGVGLKMTTSATIENEAIKEFDFSFEITYEDFSVELEYTQNYTHIGSGVAISIPTYTNVVTDDEGVSALINVGKSALISSKSAEVSCYDYSLKTLVDHGISKGNPLGLAVNSTSAGKTIRKIKDGKVYFDNRLELDSDYKNKDQYPNDVEDYERYRANLSDGSVYDCQDKVWPASNVYTKLDNYSNGPVDEYYMLLPEKYLAPEFIKIGRVTTANDGTKTIKYGLTGAAIKDLLSTYNASIRLDADLLKSISVYDIDSGFNAKRLSFEMIVTPDGKIDTISLVSKGFYVMTGTDQVKFGFDLSIDFDWSKTTYTIPSKTSEIVLN